MKSLKCRDAGYNCDAVFRGNTNDDVMRQAAEHGRSAHGLGNLTDEQRNKISSLIKDDVAVA